MTAKELVPKYKEWERTIRRELHQHPETAFNEVNTTRYIAKKLDEMGIPYEINEARHTGLVAKITGAHPGKAIMLRADIDALPVTEKNTFDFKSKEEGKMHACGHDGHIAVLLGAAKMLLDLKDQLEGDVYLVFQPAEEIFKGAEYMLKFGDWYDKVSAVFGGHLWVQVPAGKVNIAAGPRWAATDRFKIKVHGKSSHGANPQEGVDALLIASTIVVNLQSIVSRHFNPLDPVVLTVGSLTSGTAYNIVAGEAVMEGTTRYFAKEIGPELKKMITAFAEDTAKEYGGSAEVDYDFLVPPVVNEEKSVELAKKVACEILGKDALYPLGQNMVGDDFALYLEHKPGCYIFPGIYNADPAIDATHMHHNDHFNMDDSVLSSVSAIFAEYAIEWLRGHHE